MTRVFHLAARLLPFAVMPLFAAMGVYSALQGDGMQGAICSTSANGKHLPDMVLMYAIMSVSHLGPWFRLRSLDQRGQST